MPSFIVESLKKRNILLSLKEYAYVDKENKKIFHHFHSFIYCDSDVYIGWFNDMELMESIETKFYFEFHGCLSYQ